MFQSFHPELITTPFLFFTGKGGVGKTSTACASAVALADEGKQVLLVSTDPASNLQDVLEIELSNIPTRIPHIPNLTVCNLDPEEAANNYREKMIGPYRGKLPDAVLVTMEEQLSGACTVEIAAFDEFTSLLSDYSITSKYDYIIFDTAPTGHTLRLLQLPTAWTGFLEESTHGASCLGPLSGLGDKKDIYAKTVKVLSDSNKTTLCLVTRPESSSIQEAKRASAELRGIGIENQVLIMNGVLQQQVPDDEVSSAFFHRQQLALTNIPNELKQVPIYSLPFVSYNLTGIQNLRHLFGQGVMSEVDDVSEGDDLVQLSKLTNVIDDLSSSNKRIIFTMGKGGVGKTTVASAIAVGLVEQGHKVHLTTTDPAAHLQYMFNHHEIHNNLSISAIDPSEEVEKYKKEVLLNASEDLDEDELDYLQEDLNSPCTEEIAVFRAFAKVVARSENEIVVIDTAPTGHTLLLLDSTQIYHKELARSTGEVPESVSNLLPRLRDPNETSVLIVTLAETTPVLEAERLQKDLLRADIQPKWWIINQSMYATETTDPILKGRARSEEQWIKMVKEKLAPHAAIIPWISDEKIGYEAIKDYIKM
ncbi:arsenical pump-driving ATPase [Metabacillus litoralis]|uniref:arsenical pump-driving ATPase n=1 Tax=Metabacillus TaxID=2675233 RepID=UPI001B952581|nr:arsenical pump-driving ATPase [Metabacillus litoralis]UHA61637.1 arsenical pump-driving ATPase [Metabacillus litoralis]